MIAASLKKLFLTDPNTFEKKEIVDESYRLKI
jgi:hypothetical protein